MNAAPDGGLNAALLQISQHGERIATLDSREDGHFREISGTLDGLSTSVTEISDTVITLAGQVASLLPPNPGPGYRPIPAVQWWAIDDGEREKALARIRDWVQRIYRPYYGHLAAALADCWEDHPLCLVQLDWLSELWSVLYLQTTRGARDLAAQAEFGTRLLPAVSGQMTAETSHCPHRRASVAAGNWAGAR